ncbi:hypothetical protein [Haematomicrobium sanguinis]|uniref:hypothetical protein n=1 Tax=Haematomicrobium sanguinis TaxID=479106 RepID=UPI00068F4466|nr:hypothetical protein [Haematomicrobium sanguinis]
MIIQGDYRDALVQFTALGLAAIIENELGARSRIQWLDQMRVSVTTLDVLSDEEMADAVLRHATARAEDSWVTAVAALGTAARSPFSPRVGALAAEDWQPWHDVREAEIDDVSADDVLDLRFISALGEPSYWAEDPAVSTQINSGASLWEMKTRNRGEEFVQNRLALLARAVAGRSASEVLAGLLGTSILDEVGKNAGDSRTPTGLRAPSRTDNARAWCAMWGISNFPVRPVVSGDGFRASKVAGAFRAGKSAWFYLPVFLGPDDGPPVSLARYRAVARSAALADLAWDTVRVAGEAAGEQRKESQRFTEAELKSAETWARAHGVGGLMYFRRFVSDNPNAPEFWAEPGRFVGVGAV